eukprot:4514220-Amphidinium_carterae.1
MRVRLETDTGQDVGGTTRRLRGWSSSSSAKLCPSLFWHGIGRPCGPHWCDRSSKTGRPRW